MPAWWSNPRAWYIVVVAAAVPVLLGCAAFLYAQGRERADQWSSIFGWFLAAIVALTGLLTWLWRLGGTIGANGDTLERASADLACAQCEQWQSEWAARQIGDPYPLTLRWALTARAEAVMASWASVRGTPEATPIPLSHDAAPITDAFTHPDSPRRLVILGAPGAGKSMLALQLGLHLLARRNADDPVPVLLPLATWNPEQPLDDWITRRVLADHPHLRRHVRTGGRVPRSMAAELVARQRILAILDGLDEMHPAARAEALARIGASLVPGRQLILTCRTSEYEQAVAGCGSLAHTPVVEILPLDVDEVCQYLVDGTDAPARWRPIITALRAPGRAATPLAKAVSTALVAWLVKTVYRSAATDPAELLTAPWAHSQATIEQHLLAALVPAAYTVPLGRQPRTRVQVHAAERWLRQLARHLHRQGTYDLAWWALAGPRLRLTLWCTLTPLVAAALGLLTTPVLGLLLGGLFGLLLGVSLLTLPVRAPRPRTWWPSRRRVVAGLPAGLVFATAGGLAGGPAMGIAAGLTVGLTCGLLVPPSSTDVRWVVSPRSTLRHDRGAALTAGAVAGLGVGWAYALVLGAAPGLLAGLATGLTVGLTWRPWGLFCLIRLGLAIRGQAPWRLMVFLDDAHRRGLLRQAGAVYQFRHALLQDHLADDA